jgi:hypothetical protein
MVVIMVEEEASGERIQYPIFSRRAGFLVRAF